MINNVAIILIIINAVIGLFLLAFALDYLQYFKKKEKELKESENIDFKTSQEIIAKTHKKAESMLQKAADHAEQLFLEARYLNQDIKRDVHETYKHAIAKNTAQFDANTKELLDGYKLALQEVKQTYINQAEKSLKDIQISTQTEMNDYMNMLRKETLAMQSFIGRKTNEEFDAIQKQLEQYKADKLKKIDESINSIIQKVTQDVLKKTIPLYDQEKIVMDSLQEAKNEGVFTT